MQWNTIAENWTAYTPAILERWPEAEEEDVLTLDGSQNSLVGYLVAQTGRSLSDITDEIEEWRMGAMPADIRMDEARDNHNIKESERFIHPGEDPLADDRLFGDDNEADTPMGRT